MTLPDKETPKIQLQLRIEKDRFVKIIILMSQRLVINITYSSPRVNAQVNIVQLHNPALSNRMIDQIQAISPFLSRFLSAFLFVENAVLFHSTRISSFLQWTTREREDSMAQMTAHLEPAACGHDDPQRLFFTPQAAASHAVFLPFVNDPFIIVRSRLQKRTRRMRRRVRFSSAEIPLIIGANCSDSFISSFDSAELIFAVVSNHIDPRRSVLAAIQLLWFHSIITTDGPRQKKSSSSGLPEPRSTT